MAVLRGYFDDSGKDDDPQHTIVVFAGYVAPVSEWTNFEREWSTALRQHDVPYLHMKEFAHSLAGSPFAKWRGCEPERAAFLGDLVSAVQRAGLRGFGGGVVLADLRRFNVDHGLALEAYPLAMYLAVNSLYMAYPNDKVELFIDRMPKPFAKIDKAREYAQSHKSDDVFMNLIHVAPLEGVSSKCVPALQAADFAAWEALKLNRVPLQFHDDGTPIRRKSFDILLDAAGLEGMVADYEALRQLNDTRHGVWGSTSRAKQQNRKKT